MDEQQLLEELGVFEIRDDEGLRAARRPAGADLIVEMVAKPERQEHFTNLSAFWLTALWRFLEDSKQNPHAFEGVAFQASAERLSAAEFSESYEQIRRKLSLAPPQPVELQQAYQVLRGRITSFAGMTTDGEMWAGFHQANVFEVEPSDSLS